jgi:hypothetical protein
MIEVSADQLEAAVEGQHGGRAKLREVVRVSEEFSGRPVWQGVVHVFDLTGHPTASVAYAWSSPVEGSNRRRFYAVLGVPPINSAADAVRAAIVADRKSRRRT